MKKRDKIIYWIATLWLSLGMVSTGIVQFIKNKEEVDLFTHLGYPLYFLTILAIWKFLGVIAVLIPKFPVLKEWAYAGYFFDLFGATYCFIAVGYPVANWAPMFIFIAILLGSYFTYHKKLAAASVK